ncbi:Outer membrane protein assembly factor [Alteromonas sp. 38]|uniref:autotransporter assembly complex protein TamA n=1 Tax=unclassified Alteromonas TaxID=2614992 RepID=UPI0012F16E68|nr:MULTISPECIES: autotransporter assembly complex family protein [unclassified Alteromonas]CAD5246940.1 Outer membrane protein assembly factor [Alteromonas sp. 154]VXC55850.1 Outer membrane protein assembly factor [Alteromonas sp. 38]
MPLCFISSLKTLLTGIKAWRYQGYALRFLSLCLLVIFIASAQAVTYKINGVKQDKLKDNIRLHLNNLDVETELLNDPFWQDEVIATVATAVQPFGYYNSNATVEVTKNDEVVVTVSLSDPLLVSKVTREIIGVGREDSDFRSRFNAFSLKEGDVLNQPVYESFKSSMFNYALSHGYFDFYWQATRLDLVREEKEANILLIAQSGSRYNFGKLKFIGEDKAKAIIKRLTPFEEGEPYSSAKLSDFNRSLNQSGYFNRVIARPVVSDAEGLNVPIEVSLAHRPRDAFDVSIGAATDTGPRVTLGWERPWLNDRGHSISSDIFISQPEQSVTADYRIPMQNITKDYVSFEAGYQFIEYSNTSFESETLSLAAHRYFQENHSPWQHDGSITYLRETYDQGDTDNNTTSLILPGYSITYVTKDNDLNINNGNYFQFLTQVGRDNLGSDINIVKSVMEGMVIRTFFDVHRVSIRGELGAIKTNDFSQIPTSLRFYAGGDQSVRGFDYREISPTDEVIDPETGDIVTDAIGGKYLATASVEYAYRIAQNWRIAAFTDAGTATNDLDTTLTYSVGTGFHWLSPIGPVRVYVARGFAPDEKTWQLHLMLGPEL